MGHHGSVGDLNTLVVARGRAHGLDAVGIADAAPFLRTRADLEARRAAGLNADMQFTYRDPERSTDPSRTLPGARSLVVGAVRYASTPAIDEHTVADEGTAIDQQSDEQQPDDGAGRPSTCA